MPHPEFQRRELARLKACVKARLLSAPELAPRLGPFVLRKQRGEGANGAVYEAEDTRNGEHVAVKVLRDPRASNVLRFKREFRGLAHLSHANLVGLYELFSDGDEWFFSMELIDGVSFVDYARDPLLTPPRCDRARLRRATSELLSAALAMHDAGRVHCDLKPSNVLVTHTGRVVVLDFGLVALQGELGNARDSSYAGTGPRGTLSYMAPELREGARPTPASDAYAIGTMLWRALYGDDPDAAVSGDDLDQLCTGLRATDPTARLTIAAARERLSGARSERRERAVRLRIEPHFVGRETELAVLQSALAAVASTGAPQAVFIVGPSGIGKSMLTDHFASLHGGGAWLLRGRCHERESLPYKAFDGIVDALARQLCERSVAERRALASAIGDPLGHAALLRVFPSLSEAVPLSLRDVAPAEAAAPGETELRRRAFAALKALLRGLSLRAPLLMIADDLQWADRDSARLLLEVLGPPDAPALLYIGCHRLEEWSASELSSELLLHDEQEALRLQCPYARIALGALAPEQAQALAHALLLELAPESQRVAERIADEAAGVPLFVSELVRFRALQPSAAEHALSLAHVLGERVRALEREPRRVLDTLALASRPLADDVLSLTLRHWPRSAQQRALQALRALGLVREAIGGQWVLYHDRLREEAVRMLTVDDASVLHRALAYAYVELGDAEAERSIEHWLGAGEDARALEYAAAAAERAAHKLAFHRAAALYRKALELSAPGDRRRGAWYAALGEALANAGRSAEAADAFLIAARADPPAALSLRCRALQHYVRCGKTEEGGALLTELCQRVGLPHPQRESAMIAQIALSSLRRGWRRLHARRPAPLSRRQRERGLVLEAVFREFAFADPVRNVLLQSLFHEHAAVSGDPLLLFTALAWDAYGHTLTHGYLGRRATARRIARLAELARSIGTPYTDATLEFVRCAAAVYEGRYREFEAHGARAQRIFREHCPGAYWEESMCATVRFSGLEFVGPVAVLHDEAPKLLRRAHESADELTQVMLSRIMSQSLLTRDRAGEALAFLASRPVRRDAPLDLPRWFLDLNTNDALRYAGRIEQAWESYDRSWHEFRDSSLFRAKFLRFVSAERHARSALQMLRHTGQREFFEIAAEHARFFARGGFPDAEALAAATRSALAFDLGDYAKAGRLMRYAGGMAARLGSVLVELAAERAALLAGGVRASPGLEAADRELLARGVANPTRWVETLLPGFVTLTPA